MEMLEESVDMMIKLWTTDPPYDIRGKYWQAVVKDNLLPDIGVGKMTEPYQKPHPRIMLPSMSRNSASSRLAARRGWEMISANFVPAEGLVVHWRDYCDERRKLGLPRSSRSGGARAARCWSPRPTRRRGLTCARPAMRSSGTSSTSSASRATAASSTCSS